MPRQVIFRIRCPACHSVAQVRVAEPWAEHRTPLVVEFHCPEQNTPGHKVPTDNQLLKLAATAEVLARLDNPLPF